MQSSPEEKRARKSPWQHPHEYLHWHLGCATESQVAMVMLAGNLQPEQELKRVHSVRARSMRLALTFQLRLEAGFTWIMI